MEASFKRGAIFNYREARNNFTDLRKTATATPVLIKPVKKDDQEFVVLTIKDYEKLLNQILYTQDKPGRSKEKMDFLVKYGFR